MADRCVVCGTPLNPNAGWSACLAHRNTGTMAAPTEPPADLREAVAKELHQLWNLARGYRRDEISWEDIDVESQMEFGIDADKILALVRPQEGGQRAQEGGDELKDANTRIEELEGTVQYWYDQYNGELGRRKAAEAKLGAQEGGGSADASPSPAAHPPAPGRECWVLFGTSEQAIEATSHEDECHAPRKGQEWVRMVEAPASRGEAQAEPQQGSSGRSREAALGRAMYLRGWKHGRRNFDPTPDTTWSELLSQYRPWVEGGSS